MIFDVSINISKDTVCTVQNARIDCETADDLFEKIKTFLTFFDGTVQSITISQFAQTERLKPRRVYAE